jgi:hypothetical protein
MRYCVSIHPYGLMMVAMEVAGEKGGSWWWRGAIGGGSNYGGDCIRVGDAGGSFGRGTRGDVGGTVVYFVAQYFTLLGPGAISKRLPR